MSDQTGTITARPTKRRWVRGLLGGIAGMLVGSALSFGLLLIVGPATVFNDDLQSDKLSAVWSDELWPGPLMDSDPLTFALALLALGAAQGAAFVIVAPGLPSGIVRRGLAYGLVLWLLSTLSFEILGPFNLLLEPLPLVGVELSVGLPGNLLAGLIISAIYGRADAAILKKADVFAVQGEKISS